MRDNAITEERALTDSAPSHLGPSVAPLREQGRDKRFPTEIPAVSPSAWEGETNTKFKIRTEIHRQKILHRLRWKARIKLGSYLSKVSDYLRSRSEVANYREYRRILAHYERFYEHSRADRLSEEEIRGWSEVNITAAEIKERRELFQATPLNLTHHGIVVDLIDLLIEHDPSVRSVLEVGVYYGAVIDHLASKYTDVEFSGIDLIRATPEINSHFKRPNLNFLVGYALDMLEKEEIFSDVVFFNNTATRFRVRELNRFLRAIGQKGRYVVVSEPLIHLPGGYVVDPADLPLDESRPTSLSCETWPPQYVHNYKGIAEEAGFKILHYRVYEPEFWPGMHRIDLIAVNTRYRNGSAVADYGASPSIVPKIKSDVMAGRSP